MAVEIVRVPYFPILTDKELASLTSRAKGVPRATASANFGIKPTSHDSRIERIGSKTGATLLIEKVIDGIKSGEISLEELTRGFDYERMNSMSSFQWEVYCALTDPENYYFSASEIAGNMGRTTSSFERLRRRVYSHLELTDRAHAEVHRLGYEELASEVASYTESPV